MSEANVEVVRRSWEALARDGVDAMMQHHHRDVVWRAIEGAPDDVGEMHGRDALRSYLQDWFDTFDDLRSETLEIIDAGEDRVVAVQRVTGRARASGVETNLEYAIVYEVRDGLVMRGKEYARREEALRATGLSGAGETGAGAEDRV